MSEMLRRHVSPNDACPSHADNHQRRFGFWRAWILSLEGEARPVIRALFALLAAHRRGR